MKNAELILILALSYTVMLLIMTGVNRLRPGITLHHNLCPCNFRTLNYLHFIGIVIMLIIPFMGAALPVFLFSFPDKISPGQTMTFLFCFFAIAFFPWRDFSQRHHKMQEASSSLPSVLLYASLRSAFLVYRTIRAFGQLSLSSCPFILKATKRISWVTCCATPPRLRCGR